MSDFHDAIFEVEEENQARAEEIAFSRLMKTSCVQCGAPSLAVPEHVSDARCGECLRARIGATKVYSGPYTIPVGYPLGEDTRKPQERDPYPVPECVGVWVSGPAKCLPEYPDAVAKLSAFAQIHGWDVRLRYSRGHPAHSTTGKPTSLSHLIALQFGGRTNNAVAVYVKPVKGGTWAWKSVWLYGSELLPFGECGVTELKEWLQFGGDAAPEWYAEIVAKRGEADARKAQKLACDAGRHANVVIVGGLVAFCRCRLCGHAWQDGGQPWRKSKKAKEHA